MSSPTVAGRSDLPVRAHSITATPYAWPVTGPLDPSTTALLCIDWQVIYCANGSWFDKLGFDVASIQTAMRTAERVLASARASSMLVVHTREGYRQNLSDCSPAKRARSARGGTPIGSDTPWGRHLVRGEPGTEIMPEMWPLPNEVVVDKPSQGSFYCTDLHQILQNAGVRHLLITGVTADCCVSSTLREACDRGYDCLIVRDAVADVTPERTAATMESFLVNPFGAVADSVTVNSVLDALSGSTT